MIRNICQWIANNTFTGYKTGLEDMNYYWTATAIYIIHQQRKCARGPYMRVHVLKSTTMTSQWARSRLISPASRLFTQPFIQAHIKEGINAPRHCFFCWGIHQWPVNSPHKGPVTRKMIPFDDVIMLYNFPSRTIVTYLCHLFNITYLNVQIDSEYCIFNWTKTCTDWGTWHWLS